MRKKVKKPRYIAKTLNENQFKLFLDYFFKTDFFGSSRCSIFTVLLNFEREKEFSTKFISCFKLNPWKLTKSNFVVGKSISWVFYHKEIILKAYFNKNYNLVCKVILLRGCDDNPTYLRKILEITDPEKFRKLEEEWEINEILDNIREKFSKPYLLWFNS